MFLNYPDVVSVEQLSEMLGISLKSAYRLLRENQIRHFKVGRVYRVAKCHVLTYLDAVPK